MKKVYIFAAIAIVICVTLIIVDLSARHKLNNETENDIETLIETNKEPETTDSNDNSGDVVFEDGVETEEKVEIDINDLLNASNVGEIQKITYGIDVSRYQGVIDWAKVSESNTSFAMIRVGYRDSSGVITEDKTAKYNMQEAEKYGIKIGVYFFSTAVSAEEAEEEADWVADYIKQYPITYPVVYDCEGFNKETSRQFNLSQDERSDIAMAFMDKIFVYGYTPMFYAAVNELKDNAKWNTTQIERKYKIWMAWYGQDTVNLENKPLYDGQLSMWQYSNHGSIEGIDADVDLNVAYFGYDGTEVAKDTSPREDVAPNIEALINFIEVNEIVTAKNETNLRDKPVQGEDSSIIFTITNGQTATRTGMSDDGWSRVIFNGVTCYARTNLLTTDLSATPQISSDDNSGFKTKFTVCNEKVTAKELVNLRSKPSVTDEDSMVIATLSAGDTAIRTGINTDVGWSRVEYNGQVLYCISSYIYVVE